MRNLLLIGLALLAAAGCAGAPAPPPDAPSQVAPLPYAMSVRGSIEGTPFEVRSATIWQDATATWISFEDVVPATDGKYDPRARRTPRNSLSVYLSPQALHPGTYEAKAGGIPQGSPILGAALQTVNDKTRHVDVFDRDWTCTLTVERVMERKARSGMPGLNLSGRINLRFEKPRASIEGAFVAHDNLRDDELEPNAPAVPAPKPDPPSARPAAPNATPAPK